MRPHDNAALVDEAGLSASGYLDLLFIPQAAAVCADHRQSRLPAGLIGCRTKVVGTQDFRRMAGFRGACTVRDTSTQAMQTPKIIIHRLRYAPQSRRPAPRRLRRAVPVAGMLAFIALLAAL